MIQTDDELTRFINAFEPKPVDPWAGWKALARFVAWCAVILAVVLLVVTGPGDAKAGASPQSFAAWYNASPENRFHYWYASDERNASYFHIREHFGHGRLGDQAVRVASCESELRPGALNRSSGASGLFQVMGRYHASRFEQVTGEPFYDGRFNPEANAQYAADLYRRQGWGPWVCKP